MKFHKALETSSVAVHPACLDMQHLVGYTFAMETMTHLWSEEARPSYKVQTNTAALQRAYEQVIASDQYRAYWREYVETKPLSELYETAFRKALDIATPEMDLRARDISKMNAYIKEFVAAMDDAKHPMVQRMCVRAVWRSVELDAELYNIPGGAYHRPTWNTQTGLEQREWDRYLDTFHKVNAGFATTINHMDGMNIDDAVGVLGLVDYFHNFYAVEYYNMTSVEFPEYRDTCAAARALSHVCHYIDIPSQSDYYPATPQAEAFKDTMLGGIRDIVERTHLQFPCITAEGDMFESFEAFIDGAADEYVAKCAPEWQERLQQERAMLKGELGDLDPVFVSRGCVQINPFEEGVMKVADKVIIEIPPLQRAEFVRALQVNAATYPLSTTNALYTTVHDWSDHHDCSTEFIAAALRAGYDALKYDEANMAKMAPVMTPGKILEETVKAVRATYEEHGRGEQPIKWFAEEVLKQKDSAELISFNDLSSIVRAAAVQLDSDSAWHAYIHNSSYASSEQFVAQVLNDTGYHMAKFGGATLDSQQEYDVLAADWTLGAMKLEDRAAFVEKLLDARAQGCNPATMLRNAFDEWSQTHDGAPLIEYLQTDIDAAQCEIEIEN